MNLGLVLDLCVADYGDFDQFIHQGRTWRSVETLELAQRLAAGLAKMFAPGERVLTLMPNSPQVIISNCALWRAGLVAAPLHAGTTSSEVARSTAHLGASAVITSHELLPTVVRAFEGAERPPAVIVWPDPSGNVGAAPASLSVTSALSLAAGEPLRDIRGGGDDDLALVLFTGGTTGRPKGVMLAHSNVWHTLHAMPNRDRRFTAMALLPMNHIGGITYNLLHTRFGFLTVFSGFGPGDALPAIERHRVDFVVGVPAMFIAMLAYPDADRYDTSSAKLWVYGGASFPEPQRVAFERRFACEMHGVWGLTEGAAPDTSTQLSRRHKPGSVGTAHPGVAIRIVDTDGRDVAPGEIGEVWIGGPQIMRGYYDMPEETARVLADGWLRTGDLGRLDADGDLFLSGRSKDIILRGGENVYPEEIESVVVVHDAVAMCAVVGIPNELLGEEAVCFVVVKPGRDASQIAEELRKICIEQLTRYKVPRFELIDEMPKTSVGKTDRRRLREIGVERLSVARETPATVRIRRAPASRRRALMAAVVRRQVSSLLDIPSTELDLSTGFIELGLDSLQAVQLAFELGSELGLELSGTLAFKAPTGESLVDALLELLSPEETRTVTRARRSRSDEPIAVVGMAYRMPGGIVDDESLWRVLRRGLDTTEELPSWRWNDEAHEGPRRGNVVADVDKFDAAFFHISPGEARDMDPQQRLLLEVSWSALENAGMAPSGLAATSTGVYVGTGLMDYMYDHLGAVGYAGSTGGMSSVSVGRVSYVLGLRGPCIAMDTACSSSLTATHQAVRGLRGGECDVALAGGVSLCISPQYFTSLTQMGALAPDGRCKSFDASANGYGRADGCGVVVLMRLSDALANGYRVRAVIRGSAINHDGFSTTLTAPNGGSQEEVIRAALDDAGVEPQDVTLIEAHGTGTPTGDPIEVDALARVYGTHTGRTSRLYLSSLKGIVGHMEYAAGIGGLVRLVLTLERAEITPLAQLKTLNAMLPLEAAGATVPTESVPWRVPRRIAGISSFGFGGSNAHLIIEQAPEQAATVAPRATRPVQILPLSARSPEALDRLAARYRRHLAAYPSITAVDACFTAGVGRSHFDQRMAIVASGDAALREALAAATAGTKTASVVRGTRSSTRPGLVAMLFTGQGAQWAKMGEDLYRSEPVFAAALDECAAHLDRHLERPLRSVLFAAEGTPEAALLHRTGYTQPALFAIEWALWRLWTSWGVTADVLLGHSVGELVAAAAADVFSLEDACKLIAARGRLMDALPEGGAMLSVDASEADVRDLVAARHDRVSIAAVNARTQVVLSGDGAAITEIDALLAARGVRTKRLRVSHAFHSPLVEPMLDAFREVARTIRYQAPSIPYVSNVTGKLLEDEAVPDAEYWVSHVRAAVRFHDGMQALASLGARLFIEAGPHPVLLGMAGEILADAQMSSVPSLRRDEPAWNVLGPSVASFYARGGTIDWNAFHADAPGRRVALPTYAFEGTRHWRDRKRAGADGARAFEHPLLTGRTELPIGTLITGELPGGDALAYLQDHRVLDIAVFPGTGFIELALAAAGVAFAGTSLALEDMQFEHVLALPTQGTTTTSVLLRTPIDDIVEVEVHSRPTATDGAHSTWTRHARGRVRLHAVADAAPARSVTELPIAVDPAALYTELSAQGLTYGTAFRNVVSATASSDGRQCLGVVKLSGAERTSAARHQLHPALLDSALHLIAAVPAVREVWRAATGLRLPVGFRRLEVRRAGVADAYVHVVAGANIDELTIHLTDDRGQSIATLEGLELRATDPGVVRRLLGVDVRSSLYSLAWDVKPAEPVRHLSGTWLVLGDRHETGTALAAAIERAGASPRLVAPAGIDARDSAAVRRVLDDTGADLAGVISLRGLDAADTGGEDAAVELLHVSQAVASRPGVRLVAATRAGAVIYDGDRVSPAQAALVGVVRTLAEESPDRRCTMVHLDPYEADPARDAAQLLAAAGAADDEGEVAYRDGIRHVARVVRRQASSLRRPGSVFELVNGRAGSVDGLSLRATERTPPAAGQVEIAVRAAAVNFRDVLMVLGMYPGQPVPLGNECVGTVTAIGPGVTGVAVGDDVVCGFARGAFRTHATVDARFVAPVPPGLSDDAVTALPTVFLTALLGLSRLAKLGRGERVLIHSGAGGVGLAAIQIAQALGAEVIATAGSPRKRSYLHELGVTHVFDSRSLSFVDDVRRVTNGQGVDVVLSSLAAEFIGPSMGLLRDGGRFIEIGKAHFLRADEVPAGRHYHAFDLGELCLASDELWQSLWSELRDRLASGVLRPLPVRRFAIEDAVAAFRVMAQGKHIGKVVLALERSASAAPRADGTYLITGGQGALGQKTAAWLLARGAGHVVLLSRRGASPEARAAAAALDPSGRRITLLDGDVSKRADVDRTLATIDRELPPLRGVFHAAGVLDDAVLGNQTAAAFARVFAPKASGAWHLHEATARRPLDMFVMYSSLAALGSAGQANYAAANAYLDGLAALRRRMGLAATSINWGPWSEVGMATNPAMERLRSANGLNSCSPTEACEALELLVADGAERAIVANIDWSRFMQRPGRRSSLFARFAATSAPAARPSSSSVRRELAAMAQDARRERIATLLREEVAHIIGGSPADVPVDVRLDSLGIDSLRALELRTALTDQLGVTLIVAELAAAGTIAALAARVATEIERDAPAAAASIAGDAAVAASRDTEGAPGFDREWQLEVGSLKLSILEWGAETAPAVVLVHGLLDQALAWGPLARQLAREGLRVVALDLPGHGHSDHIAGTGGYQVVDALRAIHAVITRTRARLLVGHSLGGALAVAVAAAARDQLRGLVTIDAPVSKWRQADAAATLPDLIGTTAAPPPHVVFPSEARAAELMSQSLSSSIDKSVIDSLTRRLLRAVDGGVTWRSDPRTKLPFEGTAAIGAHLRDVVSESLPVLGVFVPGSSVTTPGCVDALRGAFPRTRVVEVPGGHWPHLESPSTVAAAIAAFVRDTTASTREEQRDAT